MYKDAISFFREEVERYANAPRINGCTMTEDWAFMIEMCNIAIKCLEDKCND
jgi:hypothetical protein